MTKRIDIKKSGFNVPIGELDFFFSTAEDNLMAFYDKMETAPQKELAIAEKYSEVDTDKLEGDDVEESHKQAKKGLSVMREETAFKYDVILGEGTFDELNKIYDLWALEDTYPKVVEYIVDGINKYFDGKTKSNKKVMEEYIKKQSKKKK